MKTCKYCGVDHESYDDRDAKRLFVFAVTIPKAGTNLLRQIFDEPVWIDDVEANWLHLDKMGPVAYSHTPFNFHIGYALCETGAVRYLLIRDPRDIAVSMMHHVIRVPNANMNFEIEPGIRLADSDDPLLEIIKHLKERLQVYETWFTDYGTKVILYEELFGSPRVVIQRILREVSFRHGGWALKDMNFDQIDQVVDRIRPEESPTYRMGAPGQWRETFETHHLEAWHKYADGLLEMFGYEWSGR